MSVFTVAARCFGRTGFPWQNLTPPNILGASGATAPPRRQDRSSRRSLGGSRFLRPDTEAPRHAVLWGPSLVDILLGGPGFSRFLTSPKQSYANGWPRTVICGNRADGETGGLKTGALALSRQLVCPTSQPRLTMANTKKTTIAVGSPRADR